MDNEFKKIDNIKQIYFAKNNLYDVNIVKLNFLITMVGLYKETKDKERKIYYNQVLTDFYNEDIDKLDLLKYHYKTTDVECKYIISNHKNYQGTAKLLLSLIDEAQNE